MAEHVHFFSVGKNSCTTYFETMKRICPSKVFLICDKEIDDAGQRAENLFTHLLESKRIHRRPSLSEIHILMRNGGNAFVADTTEERQKQKIDVLRSLASKSFALEVEPVTYESEIDLLEKGLGLDSLSELEKDGYAVLKTKELISNCQRTINQSHTLLGRLKADRHNTNIKEEITSLIWNNKEWLYFLCGHFGDSEFNKDFAENRARDLRDEYVCVDIGDDQNSHFVVVENTDNKTVQLSLFNVLDTYSLSTEDDYSMNISAGRNEFILSLFTTATWLNADVYLSPSTNDIRKLPLPNRDASILEAREEKFLEILCRSPNHCMDRADIYENPEFKRAIPIIKESNLLKYAKKSLRNLKNQGLLEEDGCGQIYLRDEGRKIINSLIDNGKLPRDFTTQFGDKSFLLVLYRNIFCKKVKAEGTTQNLPQLPFTIAQIVEGNIYLDELNNERTFATEGKRVADQLVALGYITEEKVSGKEIKCRPTLEGEFYIRLMKLRKKG